MQIKSLYLSFSRQDLGLLFRSGILRTNQKRLQSVIYDIDQIISTMIKDRIKFQPVYASIEANGYAGATVESENILPERIWRNLCNISIWDRLCPEIETVEAIDPSGNDPHLFDKMQFKYRLVSGKSVVAQVVLFQPPKDDRPGRLAYQATLMNDDKEINEMSVEFLVGVPDHRGLLNVDGAVSFLYKVPDEVIGQISENLTATLKNVVKWSEKHD